MIGQVSFVGVVGFVTLFHPAGTSMDAKGETTAASAVAVNPDFVSVLEPFRSLLPVAGAPAPVDLPKLLLEGNNGTDWQVRVGAFARFQSQLAHVNAAGTKPTD